MNPYLIAAIIFGFIAITATVRAYALREERDAQRAATKFFKDRGDAFSAELHPLHIAETKRQAQRMNALAVAAANRAKRKAGV